MNMIHGKSNTGEGGEDLERLTVGPDGLNKCSAIKQGGFWTFRCNKPLLSKRTGNPDQDGTGSKTW